MRCLHHLLPYVDGPEWEAEEKQLAYEYSRKCLAGFKICPGELHAYKPLTSLAKHRQSPLAASPEA